MKNKFISLSDKEHDWVEAAAKELELSFSNMLRRIIDDWHDRKNPPPPEPKNPI